MAVKIPAEMKKELTYGTDEPVQNVETSTEDREINAQDAQNAKDSKEHAETEKGAETQNNGVAEDQPQEAEALNIDTIDSLTLPGDMEPDEDQPSQRWSITDDSCADWALKKIKAEKDELDRLTYLAEQEIASLKKQIEKAQHRYEQNTTFLTTLLSEYFESVPHKKTKTGTESYQLLHGKLVKKPATVKMQPDDEKLVDWLRAAGREDLIKVETKSMWGELKKQITIVGTVAMIEETGEIVEGIDIAEAPATFSVKF